MTGISNDRNGRQQRKLSMNLPTKSIKADFLKIKVLLDKSANYKIIFFSTI
jgi:hypothetical protein